MVMSRPSEPFVRVERRKAGKRNFKETAHGLAYCDGKESVAAMWKRLSTRSLEFAQHSGLHSGTYDLVRVLVGCRYQQTLPGSFSAGSCLLLVAAEVP